jgi:hypothetical protein
MSTLTNRTIRSTYGQLIQLEDTLFQDGFGTGSLSGSYELTGSQFISGTLHVTGNLEVTGTASIGYLETIYETSSIIYSSGSTKFGDDTSDTHEFTGSVTISGSAYSEDWSGSFSGSFFGLADSASNALRATSASQADSATTASHALASSNINVQQEESSGAGHYITFAQSNVGETQLKTDSGLTYVPQTDTINVTKVIGQLEGSASYAETASLAVSTSVINVTSASFTDQADSSSVAARATTLSTDATASIADVATTASFADLAGTIRSGLTSSFADRATSASIADELSQLATSSQADNATTASFTETGDGIFSGSFSGSFQGDGKDLTNVDGYVVNNNAQERVVLATSESQSGSAATNLTFNGTTLTVVGNINTGQGATEVYLMNQNVQVSSSVQFNGLGVGTAPSGVAGAILATNDVVAFASSDERLKENLEPIGSATEKVGQLTGYTFDWVPMEGIHVHNGHDIGVIAQEVEKVLPEIVEDRGNGYKAVKYEKLTALLIQAVNEQQKQIVDLTAELNWVKNRL